MAAVAVLVLAAEVGEAKEARCNEFSNEFHASLDEVEFTEACTAMGLPRSSFPTSSPIRTVER